MAKSSVSEVLPIEDKTSSVNFVDSFPEGEAKDNDEPLAFPFGNPCRFAAKGNFGK